MKIKGKDIPVYEIPIKVINRIRRIFQRYYLDYCSVHYLSKWNNVNTKKQETIKVGFLVQVPEIWDKEEPVYEALKKNEKFEAKLIVIPAYSSVKKALEVEYKDNYFLIKYPNAIRAYNNGKWFDLRDKFDYIFYQRPYDHYLPEEYRSSNLVKYARCCYIPYGFSGSDNFNGGNTNKDFFRNIYITFAESDYIANLLRQNFSTEKEKKVHHIESLGYPALKQYFSIKPTKKYKSILWTPRWSYDPNLGGSHFFEYKGIITKLKEIYPDIELTFRPHPMLFGELIVKSMMTKEEIERYLATLKQKNIKYDTGAPVFDTFQNTDILITDFSSIVIQFFVTGRPIIYCNSENIKLNSTYQKMAEGMYIANNEEDILAYMRNLQNSDDYLYEKRQEIINTFLMDHSKATENIVKFIENDFFT